MMALKGFNVVKYGNYHGKECRVCGETLRYINGKRCVACKRKRERKRIASRTPGQIEISKAKRKIKYQNSKEESKAYSRQWRADNKEKAATTCKKWANANPEKVKEIKQEWAINNPDKTKAVSKVNSATRRGDIPKASTLQCNRCNKQARHYHHKSYKPKYWLNVEALCVICHAQADKERQQTESLTPSRAKD